MSKVGGEMNLEEVANQYGPYHYAAKQYARLAHAIRMLKQCHWWEFWRKRNIHKILCEVIDQNDNMRGFK